MDGFNTTREQAFETLKKYTNSPSLIRHGLAVEAAMRHFAIKFGEDELKWGVIGLLHDIDYDRYPDQHCHKAGEILADEGFPKDWIRSVQSHGWEVMEGELPKPEHIMEKTLYTVDQLTGLIAATVLMRPSKSVFDTSAKSVCKKFKDKAFAAKVDRAVIKRGAEMMELELTEVIAATIEGLKSAATDLGLAGQPSSAG